MGKAAGGWLLATKVMEHSKKERKALLAGKLRNYAMSRAPNQAQITVKEAGISWATFKKQERINKM